MRVLDELISELGSSGLYTHFALGYMVASLDSFTQIVLIIMYLFYISLKAKEDPVAKTNLARFFAGYLSNEVVGTALPA